MYDLHHLNKVSYLLVYQEDTCNIVNIHWSRESGTNMKVVSLIILFLYLLLPVACFAHPCESCLGNPDTEDSSGKHSHNQDADSCDSTTCCAAYIIQSFEFTPFYEPLISDIVAPEKHQNFQDPVFTIFIPPQNLA
jgi:hypothetical protein